MSAAADRPALPPFTGMALDRASTERKDAEWIRARFGDPASRAITAGHEGVLVRDGDRAAPALVRDAVPAAAWRRSRSCSGSTATRRCSPSTSTVWRRATAARRSTATT